MGTHFKENEQKVTLAMIIVGIFAIAILTTALIVYLLNTRNKAQQDFSVQQEVVGDNDEKDDESEIVSIDIGKSVDEAENELKKEEVNKKSENSTSTNTSRNNTIAKEQNTADTNSVNETTEKSKEQKEVKFTAPIKGEIIRDFTPDSLVYSQTLEEWVTHNGVDIKADKTSVVTAAADGVVYAIKTDPRYGLTVIVEHEGGYKTVYANLLTAEYVVEGEEIKSGQTIGTVGNSATFEILDDYHLHFEMLKDNEYINPNNYINF